MSSSFINFIIYKKCFHLPRFCRLMFLFRLLIDDIVTLSTPLFRHLIPKLMMESEISHVDSVLFGMSLVHVLLPYHKPFFSTVAST